MFETKPLLGKNFHATSKHDSGQQESYCLVTCYHFRTGEPENANDAPPAGVQLPVEGTQASDRDTVERAISVARARLLEALVRNPPPTELATMLTTIPPSLDKIDQYYHFVTLYNGTLSILYHHIKATSPIMLQRDDHVNSDNDMFVRSGILTHAFIEDQNTASSLNEARNLSLSLAP
ncbi:hypothetical protein DAPPUDRAFT_270202 [Daphnia pulex]|uniref:Uncharacterized protein n=1 Tax=Daphnia pulex TaxID=6669 RepID=E9I0B1_DAPPU|nr:hypothetical protein DAPPUDRAFT_270202 [Daphnia pulex]|eukprot:EFX62570.1 hypothetical protein DAPPUDRAFT_270202 [Daphnia pulex]